MADYGVLEPKPYLLTHDHMTCQTAPHIRMCDGSCQRRQSRRHASKTAQNELGRKLMNLRGFRCTATSASEEPNAANAGNLPGFATLMAGERQVTLNDGGKVTWHPWLQWAKPA